MNIKTMKTFFLAAVILILLMSRAFSQEPTVKAYDINGAIEYRRGNTGNWNMLTSATILNLNDRLKMPGDSSALLMSEKSHGKITCLQDSVVIVSSTLVEEDGFWKSLYATLMSYVSPKKPQYQSASISRGNYAMLFPADGEVMMPGDILFMWSSGNEGTAHFVLKEQNGSTYTSLCNKNDVAGTTLLLPNKSISPGLNRFEVSKKYAWTIFPANRNDTKSNFISFMLADNKTINDVHQEITQLAAKKTATDGRLYLLMEATVYEKYKMYSAANNIYQNAMAQYPTSGLVKDVYAQFISRISQINQ